MAFPRGLGASIAPSRWPLVPGIGYGQHGGAKPEGLQRIPNVWFLKGKLRQRLYPRLIRFFNLESLSRVSTATGFRCDVVLPFNMEITRFCPALTAALGARQWWNIAQRGIHISVSVNSLAYVTRDKMAIREIKWTNINKIEIYK